MARTAKKMAKKKPAKKVAKAAVKKMTKIPLKKTTKAVVKKVSKTVTKKAAKKPAKTVKITYLKAAKKSVGALAATITTGAGSAAEVGKGLLQKAVGVASDFVTPSGNNSKDDDTK